MTPSYMAALTACRLMSDRPSASLKPPGLSMCLFDSLPGDINTDDNTECGARTTG